jgi:GT2 family glycosyltransferase
MIILNRDRVGLLKRCIDSILSETTYPHYEIILVENNSQNQATFAYYYHLSTLPQIKVFEYNQPFNYSAFNNWGVQHTSGDLLLFFNNDIECIDSGWLDEMVRWSTRPDIGIVGAKLLYPNGTIQHAGLVVGLEGHANHIFAGNNEGYNGLFGSVEWIREYSAVTGACMMMRRSVFDQIGGFDENYSLAFNDIEICLRAILAGYRVVYTPFARLVHHEGATRSNYKPSADIKLAYQHLKPLIEQGDPFYNPNLSRLLRTPTYRRSGEISPVERLNQILEYEG